MYFSIFKQFLVSLSFIFISSLAFSQTNPLHFSVEYGEIVVTPSFCPPTDCPPTSATANGTFSAVIDANGVDIYFSNSAISTTPNVNFILPANPNESSGGTTREATFSFDGVTLEVVGIIDQRAFDGPLVEYTLRANISDKPANKLKFYTARPDFRECIHPICGGYFVKEVNKKLTTCTDGSKLHECYVADIKSEMPILTGAGFDNLTPILVSGYMTSEDYPGFGPFGVLTANEIHYSVTDKTAKKRFWGTINNGIVCITSPCFSYGQNLLNKKKEKVISTIDFSRSGADEKLIQEAYNRLAEGETLYASGRHKKYEGFAGTGVRFVVEQFYLPLE